MFGHKNSEVLSQPLEGSSESFVLPHGCGLHKGYGDQVPEEQLVPHQAHQVHAGHDLRCVRCVALPWAQRTSGTSNSSRNEGGHTCAPGGSEGPEPILAT
jgi:hypothetical protein